MKSRRLLEAGGSGAGGAFLGGAWFGIVGAVVGSVIGFSIALFASRDRTVYMSEEWRRDNTYESGKEGD